MPTAFAKLRNELGATAVISGRSNRFKLIRHDKKRYGERWRSEAPIGRLKHFRRVPTRYDTLAKAFLDGVTPPTIYMTWL